MQNGHMAPADCVSIMRLQNNAKIPLGEKDAVLDAFNRIWPSINFEPWKTGSFSGSFAVRGYTVDVTVNFEPGFYGANMEVVPEGPPFDEAMIAVILTLCEQNGWLAIFCNSADDTYL